MCSLEWLYPTIVQRCALWTGTPTASSQQSLEYRRSDAVEHRTRVGIFTGECLTRRCDALQLGTLFSSCESFSYVPFWCAVFDDENQTHLYYYIFCLFHFYVVYADWCGLSCYCSYIYRSVCWIWSVIRFHEAKSRISGRRNAYSSVSSPASPAILLLFTSHPPALCRNQS